MGAAEAMDGAGSPACDASAAAAETAVEDLPADVLALVLRRLDGASLAAAGCASSALRDLAADPDTWRALCLAMWPSLRDLPACRFSAVDHRALFADAFPFPATPAPPPPPAPPQSPIPLPARLVSAVDLRHAGACVMSRVVDTDASSDWFLATPFRVDALVQEGFTAAAAAPIAPADLTLSWILIDPATGRAINASSRRSVSVDRKWLTGDTVARFALVLSVVALDAVVTCDERYGHVREVSLRVEGGDGGGVSGRDGLAAVAAAMAGARCGGGAATAEREARRRYEEFVKGKRARKEWKARREGIVDLCCSSVGAASFLGFLVMLTAADNAGPKRVLQSCPLLVSLLPHSSAAPSSPRRQHSVEVLFPLLRPVQTDSTTADQLLRAGRKPEQRQRRRDAGARRVGVRDLRSRVSG